MTSARATMVGGRGAREIRSMVHRARGALIAAAALVLAATAVRAEVVEEIVAKVNDDIITRSELDTEEHAHEDHQRRELHRLGLDDRLQRVVLDLLVDDEEDHGRDPGDR